MIDHQHSDAEYAGRSTVKTAVVWMTMEVSWHSDQDSPVFGQLVAFGEGDDAHTILP